MGLKRTNLATILKAFRSLHDMTSRRLQSSSFEDWLPLLENCQYANRTMMPKLGLRKLLAASTLVL